MFVDAQILEKMMFKAKYYAEPDKKKNLELSSVFENPEYLLTVFSVAQNASAEVIRRFDVAFIKLNNIVMKYLKATLLSPADPVSGLEGSETGKNRQSKD